MSRLLRFAPLIVLGVFVVAVAWRLARPAEEEIRSQLVGQPLPAFVLPPAMPGKAGFSNAEFASGRPRMINLFASWCVPCIAEAPILMELKRQGVAIDAVAVRDRPQDVAEFLARHGDPFVRIGSDPQSNVQLALGSSGVPESFIVDGRGIIRYQHMGPIEPQDVPVLLREWEAAQ